MSFEEVILKQTATYAQIPVEHICQVAGPFF